MREIKFRAWDKISEEMYFVDSLGWDYKTEKLEYINIMNEGENISISEDEIENIILMQYTGLKDKNGVEIYEGDIVKCEVELFYEYTIGNVEDGTLEVVREFDDVFECMGPIKFENGGFWIHDLEEDRPYYLSSFELNDTTFEVIGNIYENKEIMNGL